MADQEETMSDAVPREILIRGARALAHADGLAPTLEALLAAAAEALEVESAVIVTVDGPPGRLVIAASFGLGDAAAAGLAEAMRNPAHPIARTVHEPAPAFDVLPTQPGGPALRSHLALTMTRDGTTTVLGVLALAHQQPIPAASRSIVEAVADLAAVAIELHRSDGLETLPT
jgi:GAF domain-containing protein